MLAGFKIVWLPLPFSLYRNSVILYIALEGNKNSMLICVDSVIWLRPRPNLHTIQNNMLLVRECKGMYFYGKCAIIGLDIHLSYSCEWANGNRGWDVSSRWYQPPSISCNPPLLNAAFEKTHKEEVAGKLSYQEKIFLQWNSIILLKRPFSGPPT